jgi:hypothetical protein
MQHVIVDDQVTLLVVFLGVRCYSIIYAHQVVAEWGHHEELLHHRVHVADAAQVSQATVLL